MKRLIPATTLIFALVLSPIMGIASSEQHSKSEPSILYQASKREADDAKRKKAKISQREKAKNNFRKINPCPSTGKITGACPGYVIDYIVPPKKGGINTPSNLHWKAKAQLRQKTK